MAVVKGNIRYFAFYKTIGELRADKELEPNYLVSVINEDQIDVDYVIKEIPGKNSIKLDNGFYACPIFTGNALSESVSQVYSTSKPVENQVGGIMVGDEFTSLTLTALFNRMFYGTSTLRFNFTTNIVNDVLILGEIHIVDNIHINVTSTDNVIEELFIYQDNVEVLRQSVSWVEGEYDIPVDIRFDSTSKITVNLVDSNSNAVQQDLTKVCRAPIYTSTVAYNAEPISSSIKRMDEHLIYSGEIETIDSFNNSCSFIAVPITYSRLNKAKDENGFEIQDIFFDYEINVPLGNYTVPYHCFRSPAVTASNYKYTYVVSEV